MERIIMDKLVEWKHKDGRKPLILQGARQVGKTWIMNEFGRRHYHSVAYVNLDNNPRMLDSFRRDSNVLRIIEDIAIETHVQVERENTLIILDEVQEIPEALSCLKYFCENAPGYHVIVAGSLLGVAIHKGISYPVGKVNVLTMYPLSFKEFMYAMGENLLAEHITEIDSDKNDTFREKYAEYLRKYYFVGGMPEAVQTYVNTNSFDEVRSVQNDIIALYENDFSKHIDSKSELERTRMVWNAIPMQLSKENKKFFFGKIKKGARSAEFEIAIQWLIDCGLAYKVHLVTKPNMPLKSYIDFSAYKLFCVDTGLLAAMAELDSKSLIEGTRIFVEFKGALAEQYVLQELKSMTSFTPYYYSNPQSRNEIDFLIQMGMDIVPIEVKAEENLHSKSLRAFCEKFEIKKAIRFSMSGHRIQDWLENIPLWNVSGIVNT